MSATTRPKRTYEVDGRDYYFVSRPDFDELISSGQLLEWAEFAGSLYGTPREPVERWLSLGVPVLLKIDIQGARLVRQAMPDAQLIFLAPPSIEELELRLDRRGTEGEEAMKRRLKHAHEELQAEAEFDKTIVNYAVEEAARELASLIG